MHKLDSVIFWIYKRLNNYCKKHQFNLDPPITRWGVITVGMSISLFLLAAFLSFYTIHITRSGDTAMLVVAVVFGVFSFVFLFIVFVLAYTWWRTGPHDPLQKTENSLHEIETILPKMEASLTRIEGAINNLAEEIRRDRESRHGKQSTSDKPEDM